MWILLAALTWAGAPDDCTAAIQPHLDALQAARDALDAAGKDARSSPTTTDLAHRWFAVAVRQVSANNTNDLAVDLQAKPVDDSEDLARLTAELSRRSDIDAKIRAQELTLIERARAANEARCGAGACAGDPACVGGPDKKTAKAMDRVEALYEQLSRDEANFQDVYGFAILLARVQGAGVADRPLGGDEARASSLFARLSASTARPTAARARVGAFLADVAGRPRLTPDQLKYARYLAVWGSNRSRGLQRLEGDVQQMIDTWYALDTTEAPMARSRRRSVLSGISDRMAEHDVAPPATYKAFTR